MNGNLIVHRPVRIIDLPTLCETANKKGDHNVSICKEWIEVNSKHRSNSKNFMNSDSLLAYHPIPTSSRYAHLTYKFQRKA